MKVFDAHCHLQDPRILGKVPQLIAKAQVVGVAAFAVNGVSENDWRLVKQLSQSYPSIIPSFGLHPWFVQGRTTNWFETLKHMFDSTPNAAVGEIGLDKGSKGKLIDFADQVQVFEQQLQLAKDLNRPASVHCVRAFGDLLPIMQRMGPFPAGVILHSYLGSAEMVPEFAKLGAYFSFSGFLMSMQEKKAKKMLKKVPSERILLETDAPDALPKSIPASESLYLVQGDSSSNSNATAETDASTLNHPANILHVLTYVASLVEMSREEVAEVSYENAIRLFSYRDHSSTASPHDESCPSST
ncbi:uncharacterized protein LOC133822608 [Humulus lupulus]|uniref:uncharacterized protein LOC133822608 n=1 Tax=Humulus lupulus TaxID=3486 RepID=UPI002B414D3E|nr:uncharacterized protein LOC133822608 [Humulus lupulus]